MNIYIAHSTSFDYKQELYEPVINSKLFKEHAVILPHAKSSNPFSSKEFFRNVCDFLVAEVSYPSIGTGIELGWANAFGVEIICIHHKDKLPSSAVVPIANHILIYTDVNTALSEIEKIVNR